ncbi:MAG: septum formation inhibitor Maf [Firmicutes bacterium]|nr:septum formation inhibitor Maf [Bacillota bacterium]
MEKLILASQSPRRREILENIGLKFETMVSHADESFPPGSSPEEIVLMLSEKKARAVAENIEAPAIVIGADTIVYLDGEIFEKPRDAEDAARMIRSFSGRTHTVYTGTTVLRKTAEGEKLLSDANGTKVTFRKLTEEEISKYIATGESFDKSGSYAIQGKCSFFIERVEGDFHTVVGISPAVVYSMLKELGVDAFEYIYREP